MPQAANIAIADGEATPVTHTFVPSKVSDLVATFYNASASSLNGREQLVITRREPTATVAGKINFKLVLPTEATVDSVVQVVNQELVSIDFVLPPKGVKQKRKNARVLVSNLLLNSQVIAMIDDFDGIY